MSTDLTSAREHFIQGVSRISYFWGFPKAMGAIYGAIYLSPDPLTLDDMVKQVGISKGAASTNVRSLERLKMIHKQLKVGDRKDYYIAETDFWKIVKGVLKEREQSEFDLALRSVSESLEMLKGINKKAADKELVAFYEKRMKATKKFFGQLDNIVATIVAINDLKSSTLKKWFEKSKEK